jgi:hypothetical protein
MIYRHPRSSETGRNWFRDVVNLMIGRRIKIHEYGHKDSNDHDL